MRRLLRIALWVVAAIVVLAGVAVAYAKLGSAHKLNRVVAVAVQPIAPATDAAALQRGQYLFKSRGCGECHGADGAGRVMIDSGGLFIKTPDITPLPDGAAAHYRDIDWVRLLRHGVKPDGRPVFIMPSEEYARWTAADIAAVIGYSKSLPAMPGTRAEIRLPLPVQLLYTVGVIRDAAEKIDHAKPPPAPPPPDAVSQGAYIANSCIGCHNEALSGGPIPGGPPDWPAAANLTPGDSSAMPAYPSAAVFAAMLKSGKRPDGSAVSQVMPFAMLREMSDGDVASLYAYLKTLPARKKGEQPAGG